MTESRTVIEVKNVSKKFKSFAAVDDVSFTVTAGEIVGFVGVNGAGKTTTINMLLGFTSPSKGSVEIFGKAVKPANAHLSHASIGYAAGDMELPDTMTGQRYLDFVLAQSKGDHTGRLAELTKIFSPQLAKKMHTLSRGNKQKIALIAAFVAEPKLVVLDEPTSGLDPIMQDAFLDLIVSEQAKGTTVFMSSHYLQEVAKVCSRVLLMKNGQLVEDLSAEALETTGGKEITIITKSIVELPRYHVKNAKHEATKKGQSTSFVYDGTMIELQKWIHSVSGLIDIEINERTLDAEFRALYAVDGVKS